jgi:PAS domain S-box-containing protein
MSTLSILIVEDEAIVAADLAGKIRQLGYDVVGPTATGEEAVELALRLRPELVLMDIRLAGAMDGITAAEQIHRECKLPVLFLTAHSDTGTVERARQAEAFGYVLKPFDERDLRIQIEMALYKHAAEERLAGINRILQAALTCKTEEELGVVCLEIAENITQSRIGFIGEINEKGLKGIAISNPGWEACNLLDPGGHRRPPGNFKIHGIYGRVLLDGKGFFTNDPAQHPDSIGLPDGHPPLTSFLGVPMMHEGRVIGMIAVGNREGGYTQANQDALEALMPSIVEAFLRKRTEEVIRETAVELQAANTKLLDSRRAALNMMEDSVAARRQSEEISAQLQREASERKQTEEELRKSRERLDLALASSRMATFDWDIVKNKRTWSDSVHGLLGTNPETFKGTAEEFFQIIHPEDRSSVQAALAMAVETTSVYETEYRAVWPDDSIHYISARGKVHRDDADRAVLMSGVCWDITESKQAEEKLRIQTRTLKALNSGNHALLHATDELSLLQAVCGTVVEDCGHAMVWIGYAEEDEEKNVRPVASAGFDEGYLETLRITWADTEQGRGPTGTAIRTGKPCGCSDILSDPAFEPWRDEAMKRGYVSSLVLPLMGGGTAFGALTIYSAKPQAFAEEEVDLLMQLADELAYGIRTVQLRVAHDQAEETLSAYYRRQNILADTASRLLASDSPQQVVDSLCQMVMEFLDCHAFFNFLVDENEGRLRLNACAGIPEEEKQKIEWLDYGVAVCGCAARDACRIVAEDIPNTPDPRTELVKSFGIRAYACHPLVAQGRLLGTLSFGTRSRTAFSDDDLSLMKAVADQVAIAMERKRAEEELRRSKEAAEAATRTKSQFLANMSHELRNPMTGVMGMLDLALDGSLDKQQSEYLCMARNSANSLLRILNDILDLTKVESGKLVIKEEPFALKEWLANTADTFIPEARRKGIELLVSTADDLPQAVAGDQIRLRQVLTNLVGNAVKFTEKGQVEVRVAAGVTTPNGRRKFTFTVSDTGIGIPGNKQHVLFKSFSQVDDSHTRNYGGTGLGLAISREIVELMGGTISFESKEGAGSVFSFTVPLEEAGEGCEPVTIPVEAPPAACNIPTDEEEQNRPSLLIAEDDPTNRTILGQVLKLQKFDVDFAENGQMAVEMWESGSYDLIVMDVQMPVMDGFEATRTIREKERTSGGHVNIVALTAHAFREDEQRCLDQGMDAYLSKPIDLAKCVKLVRELIGKQSMSQQ